jgi:hypothetical protein
METIMGADDFILGDQSDAEVEVEVEVVLCKNCEKMLTIYHDCDPDNYPEHIKSLLKDR